jgi:hypothetical protein
LYGLFVQLSLACNGLFWKQGDERSDKLKQQTGRNAEKVMDKYNKLEMNTGNEEDEIKV